MPLRMYLRPRLVVLNPDAPVLEAARTLESNNIGAVIVAERGEVAGIVTDRDLTTRVVGSALDPRTTAIRDVMTTPVATLSPRASYDDAIRLMQQRNIRRIPLVDEGRLVGMVTLDDLILDEAAPLEQLAAIVQAQIGQGGPTPSRRTPSGLRSAARAEATYARLLNKVLEETGLENAEQAATALGIVLAALVRRLTPNEANDLIAQLPSLLQPALRALPPGPDRQVTREAIEAELAERLELDSGRAAQLLDEVGGTIAQSISPGQMEDVRSQLPEPLRSAFLEPSAAR